MTTTSGNALKNGRFKSKLTIIAAAIKLKISDRVLRRYENGEIKVKDPQVYLNAMKLYNDIEIGLAYLESDPVFEFIFPQPCEPEGADRIYGGSICDRQMEKQ